MQKHEKKPVNLITIDHQSIPMTYTKVAKAAEIPPGSIKGFVLGDKKIAVANLDGKFHAIEDSCPHQKQPLSGGLMMGNVVMCLFHGAQFDLTSGKSLTTVTDNPLKTFPAKVEGDDVLVDF